MRFENTRFPYLKEECEKKFGKAKGVAIFELADSRLEKMIEEADYRGSASIQEHMDENMLPIIALYLVCVEKGMSEQEAYDFCLEISQIAARKVKKQNESLGKLPFGYLLMRLFCKKVMNKSYPACGWDLRWVQTDKDEMHFDMHSCIYYETTKKYGCPQMCTIFCKNDNTTLAGYAPSIRFERAGTIAEGREVCDFHFVNAKRNPK